MEKAYFSPSKLIFIPGAWKDDGTYSEKNWPFDAVLLSQYEVATFWRRLAPAGKRLGALDGRPVWVDIPEPSIEEHLIIAEQKKEEMLSIAASKIVVWQTKLLIGRKLSDDELADLNRWMDYIDNLQASKFTSTLDILWPETPA